MTEKRFPSISPGVYYKDPRAAIAWLEKAFGFEPTMVVEMPDGSIGHSELRFGDGLVMVGGEWDGRHRSPGATGGVNTQSVHVQLESGIDDHYARAKAAGAVITREIADQFYGDRVYGAADPEGHIWSFGQTIREMTNAEMEAGEGVKIRDRL